MDILMLLDNSFVNDRRVYRTAKELTLRGHKVILLCNKNETLPSYEIVDGIYVYRIFNNEIYDFKNLNINYKIADYIINNYKFQIIHAHDQFMLNLGKILKEKTNVPLIYDSHELYKYWPVDINQKSNFFKYGLLHLKSHIVRLWYIAREKKNSKYIDELITVNQSIAKILKSHFNIKKDVIVLRNVPEKTKYQPHEKYFHKVFNLNSETKVLIFIGNSLHIKTQNLEQVLRELKDQPNLAIILVSGNRKKEANFKNINKKLIGKNVFFHDLFPPEEISDYISSADIGILPIWNKDNLSYWLSLPNKMFEYMHANLPILTTSQPEYEKIINQYKIGITVNPEQKNAFLEGYKKLIHDYSLYKKNTYSAVEENCWQKEKNKLDKIYLKYS
jgi:1,2-diacylglycerol 3-alpha-glucosyltransferase